MYQHHWIDQSPVSINGEQLNTGKVVCVGRNYADHIAELNSDTPEQAVLFIKPSTSVCSAVAPIKVSHLAHLGEMHHELEIALLIGDKQRIIGVGLGIDLTLRDIQQQLKSKGLPWERSKSFDGSCAVSPFLRFDASIDLQNIDLQLILNDHIQQSSNSSMMLYPIEILLEDINDVFTLQAGDIVLTGTPAGVGPLQKGDMISASLNQTLLIDNTLIK